MTDTSVWDRVLGAAITGTRSRPAPAAQWLTGLGVEAPDGTEPQVLDVAAVLTAGRAAAPVLGGSVAVPEPVRDERPAFPMEVFARVVEDSRGTQSDSRLPEVLAVAAELGLRAPAAAVPQLLDLAARSTSLRAQIRPVVGPVGQLLAGMNPQWRHVFGPEPDGDDAWLHPDPRVRLEWLAGLRRTDPERAREYVARALAPRPEKAEFKVGVLRLLADPEQPEDSAFLEEALDARAESVRTAARQVLSGRRMDSPYQQRMVRRFEQWVRVTRTGDGLTVQAEIPKAFDEADLRDGFSDAERGDALADMVARVPLAVWSRFGSPARVVAGLLAAREYAVRSGLGARAWAEQDRTWGRALFETGAGELFWGGVLVPQELADERIRAVLDGLTPNSQSPSSTASTLVNRRVMAHVAACLPRVHPSLLLPMLGEIVEMPDPGADLIQWLQQALPHCTAYNARYVERAIERLTLRLWALDQLRACAAGAPPPSQTDPTSPSRGEP